MTEKAGTCRWMRRYKLFFLLGLLIFAVQVFLAYKSFGIGLDVNTSSTTTTASGAVVTHRTASSGGTGVNTADAYRAIAAGSLTHSAGSNHLSASDDEDSSIAAQHNKRTLKAADAGGIISKTAARAATKTLATTTTTTEKAIKLSAAQLGFPPPCQINGKEAISALLRAKTTDCRQQIARTACAIEAGHFYARHLPAHCPAGNHTANRLLGCYRDERDYRLLAGYFINFKVSNTPRRCIQLCLQSGFPYAGVQYGSECFCGVDAPPPGAIKLPDSSCNMQCAGDAQQICGGYFTMNIYETGIAKFSARVAETSERPAAGVSAGDAGAAPPVRIAFLLTLNGRALRQVHRLIRALYAPQHYFYLHVDERQTYLYRKLLELEAKFSNIRLARHRFATIWGGASLLTMLLQSMRDLLAASNWHWDFVINLSESDFPVKRVEHLVEFLAANRGRNFVKGHGRETQRFIQKQGLDKTFVECDTHMWRIGDRRLPAGIQVDGGSDWVALSRPFIEYVTRQQVTTDAATPVEEAADESDELLRGLLVIFQHTLLPAESFFHTVLRNSRFCDTYVDNNLHVTNWKRKLGCKCQYKHVVDWCGCSPNDFRPDDWSRLHGTEQKMLFFARKFEPIVNQAILHKLEEWLYGPFAATYAGLHSYWQSLYDAADDAAELASGRRDTLSRSMGESLLRLLARRFQRPLAAGAEVLELTHFLHQDVYKGVLLRYRLQRGEHEGAAAGMPPNSTLYYELETRIRPVQYVRLSKTSKFGKRLRNVEVSTDFDQKEQLARNLAKFMGPQSEPVLSFTFAGSATAAGGGDHAHTYNITLLWIDPNGRLQDFNELHIEDAQADGINFSKAQLRAPLQPGIWTVKMIGRNVIYAQVKFLVVPLAIGGLPLPSAAPDSADTRESNLPIDFALPAEWQQHLPSAQDVRKLEQLSAANGQRTGANWLDWIDGLVGRFYHGRETCAITPEAGSGELSTAAQFTLPLCRDTAWSSLAADPKSDIDALLRPAEDKPAEHDEAAVS